MRRIDIIFLAIVYAIIGIWYISTNNRIADLENRISELEKQSKEVHEYILNRIGGDK